MINSICETMRTQEESDERISIFFGSKFEIGIPIEWQRRQRRQRQLYMMSNTAMMGELPTSRIPFFFRVLLNTQVDLLKSNFRLDATRRCRHLHFTYTASKNDDMVAFSDLADFLPSSFLCRNDDS